MVGFDTTFLTWLFVKTAKHKLSDASERVGFLLSELSARGDQIIVPTPAMSELLMKTGKGSQKVLEQITGNPRFVVASFDLRAAIELSLFSDAALTKNQKKVGVVATWAKMKFDRQIVAICKVEKASCIYSDDEDVYNVGHRERIPVYRVEDIQIPSKSADPNDFKLTAPNARLLP